MTFTNLYIPTAQLSPLLITSEYTYLNASAQWRYGQQEKGLMIIDSPKIAWSFFPYWRPIETLCCANDGSWRELHNKIMKDLKAPEMRGGADMVHARELIKLAACDVIDYGQLITGVHPCAVICHSQSEALVLPPVKVTYMAAKLLTGLFSLSLLSCLFTLSCMI